MRAILFDHHGSDLEDNISGDKELQRIINKGKYEYKKEHIVFYDYPTKSEAGWIRKDTRKNS